MSQQPEGASPWEKQPSPGQEPTQMFDKQQPGGSQYGQPQYGQPPAYPQDQFSQGQGAMNQYAPPANYGQPAYGQPQYGQPAFGGPQYQQVPAGYYPVFNSQGQQVLVPLASPGKRFGTYLLEAVLVIVTLGIGYLIWLLIAWGKGQTPGKQVTKLKYVNVETGQVADWGKSAFRDFVIRGIVIGFIGGVTLYIGFLIAAFMTFDQDKNYRAGWDRLAGTVVVDVSNVQL